jgi:hypothetical protein
LSKEERWLSPDKIENGFNPGALGFDLAQGFLVELPESIGYWTIEEIHWGQKEDNSGVKNKTRIKKDIYSCGNHSENWGSQALSDSFKY